MKTNTTAPNDKGFRFPPEIKCSASFLLFLEKLFNFFVKLTIPEEMPYKARFRHEWWSVDIRYIEKHGVEEVDGYLYQISILENYSRAILGSRAVDYSDAMGLPGGLV